MQSTGQQRGLTGVWRAERQARWFFAAHLQGALGTGAGSVALLLLAYLLAIALLGAGLPATAASPILPLAMRGFSVAGIGNGLFLVTVRVLMQKLIPKPVHGRAFGLLDAIDSWGFGAAIVAGGALAATSAATRPSPSPAPSHSSSWQSPFAPPDPRKEVRHGP